MALASTASSSAESSPTTARRSPRALSAEPNDFQGDVAEDQVVKRHIEGPGDTGNYAVARRDPRVLIAGNADSDPWIDGWRVVDEETARYAREAPRRSLTRSAPECPSP